MRGERGIRVWEGFFFVGVVSNEPTSCSGEGEGIGDGEGGGASRGAGGFALFIYVESVSRIRSDALSEKVPCSTSV